MKKMTRRLALLAVVASVPIVTGAGIASAAPTGCSMPITIKFGVAYIQARCTSGTGTYQIYLICYNQQTGRLGPPVYSQKAKIGEYTYANCISSVPNIYSLTLEKYN